MTNNTIQTIMESSGIKFLFPKDKEGLDNFLGKGYTFIDELKEVLETNVMSNKMVSRLGGEDWFLIRNNQGEIFLSYCYELGALKVFEDVILITGHEDCIAYNLATNKAYSFETR